MASQSTVGKPRALASFRAAVFPEQGRPVIATVFMVRRKLKS